MPPNLTGVSWLPNPTGFEGSLDSGNPGVPAADPQLPQADGIRYTEVWPDSPQVNQADDGSQATRRVYVDWDKWQTAAKNFLGYPVVFRAASGVFYIRRKLPAFMPGMLQTQHPCGNFGLVNDPPRPWLWATSVKNLGRASPKNRQTKDSDGVARFRAATLDVTYESLTYEVLEDSAVICFTDGDPMLGLPDESSLLRYVSPLSGPQAQYLTLPPGSFMLASYAFPVPGSPGKVVPESDLSLTWHRIPLLAVGDRSINKYITSDDSYIPPIEDCIGKVNKYDFNGHKKGTLLLVAAVLKPIRSAVGHRLYDIEYRFKNLTIRSVDRQTGTGWTGNTYAYGHNLLYWSLSVAPPTGPGNYEVVVGACIVRKGTLTIGSGAIAALEKTDDLAVGMFVTGNGIPAGAQIGTLNGSAQLTLAGGVLATTSGQQNLTFTNGATSNARKDTPADGKNIYDYRDFKNLFRVPTLNF